MGLLDFDDDEIMKGRKLPTRGRWRNSEHEFEPDRNFSELQNLGHKENSADFEDSPFADRQPKQEEE
jgi:hypothetical protein